MTVAFGPSSPLPCLSPWPTIENPPSAKLNLARQALIASIPALYSEYRYVSAVVVQEIGSGYSATPAVTFAYAGFGNALPRLAATAAAVINVAGELFRVDLDEPGDYPLDGDITASLSGGAGTGALVSVMTGNRLHPDAADDLGRGASELCTEYLAGGTAPQALLNGAVVAAAGYLVDMHAPTLMKEGIGPITQDFVTNHADWFRRSAAASMLAPYRIHRAKAIG